MVMPLQNFLKGIKIPINPFLGMIGTSLKEVLPMILLYKSGGNMDNRLLKGVCNLFSCKC